MAWLPKMMGTPHVVEGDTGDPLAMCIQAPHESLESGWSRACVMAAAPELHAALSELIVLAKRNVVNEELLEEIGKCEKVLNKVKEFYDNRG